MEVLREQDRENRIREAMHRADDYINIVSNDLANPAQSSNSIPKQSPKSSTSNQALTAPNLNDTEDLSLQMSNSPQMSLLSRVLHLQPPQPKQCGPPPSHQRCWMSRSTRSTRLNALNSTAAVPCMHQCLYLLSKQKRKYKSPVPREKTPSVGPEPYLESVAALEPY